MPDHLIVNGGVECGHLNQFVVIDNAEEIKAGRIPEDLID
jgi:hypothetical protein